MRDPKAVRPGPVEGLFFSFEEGKGMGFDKLSPNGSLSPRRI